tara:strand:+ start:297 stop:602 length:306 start_codon:yes stop_codon:yes gene_type:complete
MQKVHLVNSGGIDTSLHFDDEGKTHVVNSADLTNHLEYTKEMRNDDLGRGKDMRHVASVPMHVLYEMYALWDSMGLDRKTQMKKFLNDSNFKAFRTSNDRV